MTRRMQEEDFRIEPQPPYTPHIGALVQMMAYARFTTLQAVDGLSMDELDAVPTNFTNSIGMLLAHIAATDRMYQYLSFEGVDPMHENVAEYAEYAPYIGAMTFGKKGEKVRGRTLDELLTDLDAVRTKTLTELAGRGDTWLASRLSAPDFDYPNHHWAWFHVMEDEVSHRGQIRLIRKALKQ
ncbi:DinB family protein [Deinococcus rubellus]|uniref:DinB family protein n=1 Tax=Deinococcus rubellus TaxID=1889240 RepID=A0ABY5YFE4_9DEIO|nr:DinB family protein [Deinococcus rubellus]UWX63671.1 DinB family protein [Deinococcus rubellus]